MKYFIDTSFLIALASKDDKYHKDAVKLFSSFKNNESIVLITSDYVIDEFLLLIMKIQNMKKAIQWSKTFMDEIFCSIYYCNDYIFKSAMNIFQSELDERKPLTLTDAVVFISSNNLSCEEILTFDKRLKNYK